MEDKTEESFTVEWTAPKAFSKGNVVWIVLTLALLAVEFTAPFSVTLPFHF